MIESNCNCDRISKFVDELPIGATGKVLKIELREQYKDHLMK